MSSRSSSPLSGSSRSSSPHGGWLAHQGGRVTTRSPVLPPPKTIPTFPSPQQQPQSLSLTESLMHEDGVDRVFSLPDPTNPYSLLREKYHDALWTTLFLFSLSTSLVSSILVLFLTHKPKGTPSRVLPYYTLLHTVPLMTITTFFAAALAYANLWAMKLWARPVMIVTAVCVPLMLGVCAVVGFVGSFMWEDDQVDETWGETVGCVLFYSQLLRLIHPSVSDSSQSSLSSFLSTPSSASTVSPSSIFPEL